MPTSTITSTRKPRGQGASRRAEILAAATRIFLEEGVAHATMRRIAAAVGVSATALYVYFPDKDAILRAIAEATFAELLQALEASKHGPGAAAERFRAGLHAYVAFGLRHADAYRLTFSAPLSASIPCDGIADADHSFAILQRGIEEGMADGTFRPGPSAPAAEAVWACLHGITALLLDQAQHLETAPAELASRVIDTAIAGLR